MVAAEHADQALRAAGELDAELKARWAGAFHATQQTAMTPVLAGMLGAVTMFCGWAILCVVGKVTVVVQVPMALLTWGLLEWATRGWMKAFTMPSLRLLAAQGVVRCGGCGAMTHVVAGSKNDVCTHCQSTLLTPSKVAADLLNDLEAARLEATEGRDARWLNAVSAGKLRVVPSIIAVSALVLVVFPALGGLAWLYKDVVPFHAGWMTATLLVVGVVSVGRWIRVVKSTVAKRHTMEAQLSGRLKALLAHKGARPLFPATLRGRDSDGVVWVSDGALLVRASLVEERGTGPLDSLSPKQIDTVLASSQGRIRGDLGQLKRGGVGDYTHPSGVRLAHGYIALLQQLERGLGTIDLVFGGARMPVALELNRTRIGVLMPKA